MKITLRVWILIGVLFLSVLAISPWKYFDSGVVIKSIDKNTSAFESGIRPGMIIKSINDISIKDAKDYSELMSSSYKSDEQIKTIFMTNKGEFVFLFNGENISVSNVPKSNLRTGLDLSGGARALVMAENVSMSKTEVDDLVSITSERLNAFGLNDVTIRSVSDLEGNNFMLIEIAGSTTMELKNLLESQGKFEAKIGEDIVFIGGDRDVTYVGSSGQDAGIYACDRDSEGYYCQFRFAIALSEKASNRQAEVTSNLSVNLSSNGKYLEKPLDLYVDDILLDTLQIGADLKGRATTNIQISGSGRGVTQQDAYKEAEESMKKLQTILKTGSLPYKLKIVKLDSISPTLGKEFTKNLIYLALLVFSIVSLMLFIRYKKIKITGAIILTMFSEALITLAIASLLKQNLDASSIAGIIAGMGTGVDDQIVILSETFNKKESNVKIKQRLRNAFMVIIGAFLTTVAAMIPLFWAGAGMLKGFALTTIIGVTAGILITRPAFSDIIEQIKGE